MLETSCKDVNAFMILSFVYSSGTPRMIILCWGKDYLCDCYGFLEVSVLLEIVFNGMRSSVVLHVIRKCFFVFCTEAGVTYGCCLSLLSISLLVISDVSLSMRMLSCRFYCGECF